MTRWSEVNNEGIVTQHWIYWPYDDPSEGGSSARQKDQQDQYQAWKYSHIKSVQILLPKEFCHHIYEKFPPSELFQIFRISNERLWAQISLGAIPAIIPQQAPIWPLPLAFLPSPIPYYAIREGPLKHRCDHVTDLLGNPEESMILGLDYFIVQSQTTFPASSFPGHTSCFSSQELMYWGMIPWSAQGLYYLNRRSTRGKEHSWNLVKWDKRSIKQTAQTQFLVLVTPTRVLSFWEWDYNAKGHTQIQRPAETTPHIT